MKSIFRHLTFLTLLISLFIINVSAAAPDDEVTARYALTSAARLRSVYYSQSIASGGEISYAFGYNIASAADYPDLDALVSREKAALLLTSSLPEGCFESINSIDDVFDVDKESKAYDSIMTLYNAGIVNGCDEYGAFKPDRAVKKHEFDSMLDRIANTDARLSFVLPKVLRQNAPLYFIDDRRGITSNSVGTLGWDFDTRGNFSDSLPFGISDISTIESSSLIREITEISSGSLTFEILLDVFSADDGFSITLCDGRNKEKAAMQLVVQNGEWCIVQDGKETSIGIQLSKGNLGIKTVTNLDSGENVLYINGENLGSYKLSDGSCAKVNHVIISSSKAGIASVNVYVPTIYTGYALNEQFLTCVSGGSLNDGWVFETTGGSNTYVSNHNSNAFDTLGATLSLMAGTVNTLKKSFETVGGKVCFEMKYYLPQNVENMSFSLCQKGKAITVTAKGGNYYAGETLLCAYNNKVWQTVRIEVNTSTGKVVYKLNNRKCAEGYTNLSCFDGISVTVPVKSDCTMYCDDFYVFNMFDESKDYVPAPSPIASDGYEVGVEVCDIWRNGYQFGWDCTSSFDELTTDLGFFDEGSSEVADWETKWLCEHGIDFKLVCWYGGVANAAAPLKLPRNSAGINAYMNSKYSDMVKYAIMYENSGNIPQNIPDFRNNILAYWLEYYLSDKDRYYTIDNKALITIYRPTTFLELCGNDKQVMRSELDNIRNECRKLGYDGAIILTVSSSDIETAYSCGFDGVYAYNWGTASNNPEYQKSKLIAHRAANTHSDFDVIPTIGVGFCNIALNNSGTRTPNITNPDYENVLSWAKNTYLAGQNQSFAENLVILSNWNEVGEGHFIMPGTRNGFGYLDCIRKVFTSDTTHTDISPSESERSRFNSLFLQNRKKIRRLFNEENSDNVSNLVSSREWDFSVSSERQKWSRYYNLTSYVKTAQSIKGTSTKSDFCVYSDTIKTDSAKATTVRIRMKNDPATSMATSTAELYYITSADSEWNDSKRIVFAVTTDGAYHDYYINTRSKPLWNSDIIQIRIDAMTTPGTFEISNVALMYDPTICNVSVNNTDVTNKFDFSPERTPNGLMVSIDPLDGILSMLGAYHEWDSKNGVLTIYSNNHSITTSLGSALAVTDRGNVTMANEMYLRDGLPILCFDTIASALDFILEYDESNQVYNIYKNQSIKEESQDPYSYTFDTSGYMQNWSYTCATLLKQDNGALYFRAETNGRRYDPTFVSPDISIDAQKFKKVEITFRYSMTQASSSTATLFFRHKDDIFAATMCSQLIVPNASSNGFITYTFDMTDNESWNGTITQLRFDPFESSAGTFDIDSVRILE